MQVGTIKEIWRFPVKSLGGELVPSANIVAKGVADDRCWAVRDELTGEIVGGKKIPGLMMMTARYIGDANDAFGKAITSVVEITLPDGQKVRSDDPYVSAILSMYLGRRVSLISRPTDKAAYKLAKQMTPSEVRYALGMKPDDPDPDFSSFSLGMLATLSRYTSPPGTLYDVYPLHFLTTAALTNISSYYPEGDFSSRRYRPNFLIETDPALEGMVENDWRGRDLRIGDAVIRCNHPTIRCSMPGAEQPGLPKDPNIPLTVMKHAGQHIGAYGTPRNRAQIKVGDTVELLPQSTSKLTIWFDQVGRRIKSHVIKLGNQLGELQERAGQVKPGSKAAVPQMPPGFASHKLVRREQESDDVVSFWFAASDSRPLPRFVPGQHIVLTIPQDDGGYVYRPYSLSSASNELGQYRISVKRETAEADGTVHVGSGSGYLHDRLAVGDTLHIKAPGGQFATVPTDNTPLIMISGGIGITPFLSILQSLAEENPQRDVYLFHGVRHVESFPFRAELEALSARLKNFHLQVHVSQASEAFTEAWLHAGRLKLDEVLAEIGRDTAPHFMLCGKPEFSKAMHDELQALNVSLDRIHAESFGASRIRGDEDDSQYAVAFSDIGQELQWTAQEESLLSLAESNGIEVSSGCRYGACQACEATLLSGEVSYPEGVQPPAGKNRILLCSARPKSDLEIGL